MDVNGQTSKLPLWIAVLININVIVGGAFFISAPKIAKFAGLASPLVWLLGAALFLPIATIFAELSKKFPHAGGIYVYPREAFGRISGFMTGWVYFVGSTAGVALIVDALAEQFLSIIPLGKAASVVGLGRLSISLIAVFLCTLFSAGGVKIMEVLQLLITWLKAIPFVVVALACIFVAAPDNLAHVPVGVSWFSDSLPLVAFSFIGIETCCAMAHEIQDGFKNVARATYYSLFLTAIFYCLTQFGLMLSMGTGSFAQGAFTRLGWLLGNKIGLFFPALFSGLVLLAIASSYLGGAYSIFCSNNWIIYAMAGDLKGPASKLLCQLNSRGEPKNCILLQGAIMAGFLILSRTQTWMIQISVIAILVAFLAIAGSFLKIFELKKSWLSGSASLACVAIMTAVTAKELSEGGVQSLVPLTVVTILGLFIFWMDTLGSQSPQPSQ